METGGIGCSVRVASGSADEARQVGLKLLGSSLVLDEVRWALR